MGLVFRFFSSRITWVFIFSILLIDIHFRIIYDVFTLNSLDINVINLFDYPLDIVKSPYYAIIVLIYKIVTTVGIVALSDIIYTNFLVKLKEPTLNHGFDEPKYSTYPTEVKEILNYQPVNNDSHLLLEDIQHPISNSIKPNPITTIKYNKNQTIDDYLMELQNLVGLHSVKKEINSIINFIRVNQLRVEKGLPVHEISYHMVFSGHPGTGKTTVARILANIFRELGILSNGHYIEVDRSGLVAGYMGQTALKTKDVIDRARGGVLFIDEAYSLSNESSQNDYGHEAIDTLLKSMEDYRSDLIVIVAGYNDLMRGFVNSNPGLKSRFNRFIVFEDYNPNDLFQIITLMSDKSNYVLSRDAETYLRANVHIKLFHMY